VLLMLKTNWRESRACRRLNVTVPSPSTKPAMYAESSAERVPTCRVCMIRASHRRALDGVPLAEARGTLVEAAGQLYPTLSSWAGLCLHPAATPSERGVLSERERPNPSAGSARNCSAGL